MRRRLSVQFMVGITATLVLMLTANLVLVWRQQKEELLTEAYSKARTVTEQLISTRLFIARNQDRINKDSLGHFEFKGMNPAAVGRGVGAIFQDRTGAQVKQTRFQVRRPENAPDSFDWEALNSFADNPKLTEFYKQVQENGQPVFRYAVPLRIEKECLVCHGEPAGELDVAGFPKEGYKEGQLGGAISVRLPIADAMARIRHNTMIQVWVIVLVTAVSVLMSYLLSRHLVAEPLQRLSDVAAAIGAGKLTVPPEDLKLLKRSEELGVVADNIESMAASLQELYNNLEEKVTERTRELAQANLVQSQFFATVSHELRTPLTSIIAFTELLLKQANGQQREYLEDVLESSRRLLDMVNNLLDLSRLEAGRVELFPDVVDLSELLVSVERSLRPLADKKRIALQHEPMHDLPLLMVDQLRVTQILVNLINNAIKFTPEGGTVTVGARRAAEPGWVAVSVADNGPGVAPEHRTLIFEAFRRVEAKGLQQPGSGLGLAVARNLVELHGGRIWVEDAPGGGSLFTFTLPEAPTADDEGGEA